MRNKDNKYNKLSNFLAEAASWSVTIALVISAIAAVILPVVLLFGICLWIKGMLGY